MPQWRYRQNNSKAKKKQRRLLICVILCWFLLLFVWVFIGVLRRGASHAGAAHIDFPQETYAYARKPEREGVPL
jgi:hypothetical protein